MDTRSTADGHFFIYAKFSSHLYANRKGKFLPFIEGDISSDKSSPKSQMIYFVLTFEKKDYKDRPEVHSKHFSIVCQRKILISCTPKFPLNESFVQVMQIKPDWP